MKQYHDLLRSILENGREHHDRTGVGTISHFGYQTRFDLRAGFPIVTTKKIPFRWVAEELFGFSPATPTKRICEQKASISGLNGPTKNTLAALIETPAILAQFMVIYGALLAEIIPSETVSIRLQG